VFIRVHLWLLLFYGPWYDTAHMPATIQIWTQVYFPFGPSLWPLSTFVAAIPTMLLFYMLAGRGARAHWSALSAGGMAVAIASLVFHMPWTMSTASFLFGAGFGIKIAWIVVCAVYLYDISVETGQFEIMKDSVAALSSDRRLQALLVAFAFGAFIEGCAGFGAPIAISGAFMIGLGFDPFNAAILNLIANTAPVAWGSIGTPVHTLAAVTGLPESDLSAALGRILPITGVIVPFWMVRVMVAREKAPWKKVWEVWPAILTCGLSFSITQFLWANYVDSNLVDIAAAAVCLFTMVIFLKFWKPPADGSEKTVHPHVPLGKVIRSWTPFLILSVFVLLWGLPAIKNKLNDKTTPILDMPWLHNQVQRDQPVVAKPTKEAARFDANWLTATGTAAFLAALLSGLVLGLGPVKLLRMFFQTLSRMRFGVLAITSMLGLGYVTRYSGMDAVLGLAFTHTGWMYPFFGTFLGWLGVALTGSDTASNALFGSLQRITAQQLRIDPILMGAANSAGGVMGKMVDAQSIVVATAATRQFGQEGRILRALVWHSLALASIVGVIVMVYAYLLKGAVPHGLTFVK
jgi:lactate permease